MRRSTGVRGNPSDLNINGGASAGNDYWRDQGDLPSRTYADPDGCKRRQNPNVPRTCTSRVFPPNNLRRGKFAPDAQSDIFYDPEDAFDCQPSCWSWQTCLLEAPPIQMATKVGRTKPFRILACVRFFHVAFREIENFPQILSPTYLRIRKTPLIADHLVDHAPKKEPSACQPIPPSR
jgi:hypothetical protein